MRDTAGAVPRGICIFPGDTIMKNTLAILMVLIASAVFFLALIVSVAKQGYPWYAIVFQNGVLYDGESRAMHYAEYLLAVILPISLLSGLGLTSAILWIVRRKEITRK